jgi:hypothetical protein
MDAGVSLSLGLIVTVAFHSQQGCHAGNRDIVTVGDNALCRLYLHPSHTREGDLSAPLQVNHTLA